MALPIEGKLSMANNRIERLKSPSSSSTCSMDEVLITSSNNSSSICLETMRQLPREGVSGQINIIKETAASSSSHAALFIKQDLYEHIDPLPAYPPSYDLVNPNKEVRFPIFGDTAPCPKSSLPPLYAPAVYELTLISLKLERLSPYEISSNRSWRNFIIEINSTQLNFLPY